MLPFTGTPSAWNELIASLPLSHMLQSWEWSQVKVKFGWQALPFIWREGSGKPAAAAMVLKRTIPVRGFAKRMCILYIPKGPLLDWADERMRHLVLEDLRHYAARQGAILVKIDPDVTLGTGLPGTPSAVESATGQAVVEELPQLGWRFSPDQIQFRNTVLIDLAPSEEQLLQRMKQKTRYNIRLAQKKGVTIRPGTLDDLPLLYRMYAETSVRDGFLIREEGYYQTVWRIFMKNPPSTTGLQPFSEPLIAEVAGEVVSAVCMFYFARQAVYLFGMSRQAHREKMPNHLLQWEAIRRAKALGCSTYNLWGAPDEFNENDRLWNVFRFKEGLGGFVLRTIGAWDYTPNPLLYQMYTHILPRVMGILRSRGKARTRQGLGV